jgi:hypothetical protein
MSEERQARLNALRSLHTVFSLWGVALPVFGFNPFAGRESLATKRPVRFKFPAKANASAGTAIKVTTMVRETAAIVVACYSSATVAVTAAKVSATITPIATVAVAITAIATTIAVAIAVVAVGAVAIVVIFSGARSVVRAQGFGGLRCHVGASALNAVEMYILRKCACAK